MLHGLQFWVLEPPDPRYPFAKPDSLWLVDRVEADSDSGSGSDFRSA